MIYPTLNEGDRVAVDFNNGGQMEVRYGTVVQVSSTQPHIAWVDWDNGPPRWQMVGTAKLRVLVDCTMCGGSGEVHEAGYSLDRRVGIRTPDPQCTVDYECPRCRGTGAEPGSDD